MLHIFCFYENRGADQRHCFPYIDNTTTLLNFKPLAIFIGCTDWFVLDLVGNPEDRILVTQFKYQFLTASKSKAVQLIIILKGYILLILHKNKNCGHSLEVSYQSAINGYPAACLMEK